MLIAIIVVGLIVAAGIWIHKVGITKAKAEIKADIADVKADIAKLLNKQPPTTPSK